MPKGRIQVPRDYQERIVAYINTMGNDAFTARDCATATSVPLNNAHGSLRGRCLRGELEEVLVDGAWLYTRKDDPKITCVSPGLVAELVWATLKDAGSEEELTLSEIARRIAAQRPELFVNTCSIAFDLHVWYRLDHLRREGKRRQYRYRLTDAARALPERPVILWRLPVPQPHMVR